MTGVIDNLLHDVCQPGKVSADDLKILLSALSDLAVKKKIELSSALVERDLSPVIQALGVFEGEEAETMCEIIRLIFDNLPTDVLLAKYEIHMIDALGPQRPSNVKLLALRVLHRCARDSKVSAELINGNHSHLLSLLIDRLTDPETSETQAAENILLDLCSNQREAVKVLFYEGSLAKKFKVVAATGSIQKLRIVELTCKVAAQSEENYTKMKPRIEEIFIEIQNQVKSSQDVLVLLNYIELLRLLVAKEFSHSHILSNPLLPLLETLLKKETSEPSDPLSSLYIPGLIGFFAALGYHAPSIVIQTRPSILSILFRLCGATNSPYELPALAAVAQVSRSCQGKRLLEQHCPQETRAVLRHIGGNLGSSRSSEVKVDSLKAFAFFIEIQSPDHDIEIEDVSTICERWTQCLSPSGVTSRSLHVLWDQAKVPFEDHRSAAHTVLRNIAFLHWGRIALLLDLPGFYEWLTDRSTETEKRGKEAKYEIVAAILEEASSIGDGEMIEGLRKFFKEGPFFALSESTVASEGAE